MKINTVLFTEAGGHSVYGKYRPPLVTNMTRLFWKSSLKSNEKGGLKEL